ncbi:hypothetical protein M569_14301 [Genlisea aurea]|uniref:F-box domain-containing protein n=1 Tax=Genlisea aurea TaxID=192259 RepID=S8C1D2_9LAMI|nr:hypothetical protein M569_14301 [Genlisea aurea]
MGALISSFRGPADANIAASAEETGLGDLPESCAAELLLRLDPPQICRLAVLNRAFRAASSTDFVWESKLPTNYADIIERLFEGGEEFASCKRNIYSMLCRPNFFDGETKKAWLDKSSGKTCLLISFNGLSITGIDDRRYWTRIPTEESRFSSVAYCQQIWWLEVYGEIEFPFSPGSYSIFYRLHLGRAQRRFGRRVCSSEHVHGWDKKPVKFQISSGDGQQATKQCHLKEPGKWIHYHAGDFAVEKSCRSMKLKLSMMQIDCTHTKGGLCVDSVVIYPCEYRERLQSF